MAHINCREICELGDVDGICLICGSAKTAHGKVWEGPVCKMFIDDMNLTGEMDLSDDIKKHKYDIWNYNSNKDTTSPHDIDEKLMEIYWSKGIKNKYGVGVSVKLIKRGCDVCMGKLENIWKHFNEGPWSMIVGFYELKTIDDVECLCIDEVYYLPFLRGKVDRDLFFGKVDDNWPDKLIELEKKVKEAKTYKGGEKGVKGLTNDSIDFIRFVDLTHNQKTHRLNGGTNQYSTLDEIRIKAKDCQEEINRLLHELSPDKETPVDTAVKLSKGNARVQGRVSYTKFSRLVKNLGEEITDEPIVIDNGLLDPIKKIDLQGGGEHHVETPTKHPEKCGGNRRTKKQKKKQKKTTKKRVRKKKN